MTSNPIEVPDLLYLGLRTPSKKRQFDGDELSGNRSSKIRKRSGNLTIQVIHLDKEIYTYFFGENHTIRDLLTTIGDHVSIFILFEQYVIKFYTNFVFHIISTMTNHYIIILNVSVEKLIIRSI